MTNRTYLTSEAIVFKKTTESFGGLSNMAGGFPIQVNQSLIKTSEALYQACRFPHLPDVQAMILAEASPMAAKMKIKHLRANSRPDWEQVKVKIMRWSLRAKLLQNYQDFSTLLLATSDNPIVEESNKDSFWGAKPTADGILTGQNILGRLLMELREERKTYQQPPESLAPLTIPNFYLLGEPILDISLDNKKILEATDAPQINLF